MEDIPDAADLLSDQLREGQRKRKRTAEFFAEEFAPAFVSAVDEAVAAGATDVWMQCDEQYQSYTCEELRRRGYAVEPRGRRKKNGLYVAWN